MKRPLHPVTNDTACPAYPMSYVDMQAMTALMTATCEFCKERDIRDYNAEMKAHHRFHALRLARSV